MAAVAQPSARRSPSGPGPEAPRTSSAGRLASLAAVLALLVPGGWVVGGQQAAEASTAGRNGLIAFESTRNGASDIYVKAIDGSGERPLTSHPKSDIDPAWSPDGTRIAYSGDATDEGHQNIYVMNADGTGNVLLTPGARTSNRGYAGSYPTWSPDGSRIAWDNYGEIWVMNADGSGKTRIVGVDTVGTAPAWSPDGSRIAYISGWDVWTVAPDGSNRQRLTTTSEAERTVDWAPDGSALAVERNGEIWRMNPDGTGAVKLTTSGGAGQYPVWSPDGRLIAFGTNGYGSTTAHEIVVMGANGSDVTFVPPLVAGTDTDPSWQVSDDATAPVVSGRTPAQNARAVVQSSAVTATFSESVQGVAASTFTLRDPAGTVVPATVSYDPGTRTATLDPTGDLAADTTWRVRLLGGSSGIRDLAGNPLTTQGWSFTTGPRPAVTARTPLSGARAVWVGTDVSATFDEPVQGVGTSSFTLRDPAGTVVAATVTYDAATRTATLDPSADLAPDTRWRVTLTGGKSAIRDLAGNPLTTLRWSFTTGPRPWVTARSPGPDATGVEVWMNMVARFSEQVQGVSGTTFTLRDPGGATVAATVTYNPAYETATLDPAADLAPGTTYRLTLTGGSAAIRDLAGNPLITTRWRFTTAP